MRESYVLPALSRIGSWSHKMGSVSNGHCHTVPDTEFVMHCHAEKGIFRVVLDSSFASEVRFLELNSTDFVVRKDHRVIAIDPIETSEENLRVN